MEYIKLSEMRGLPRIVSIQNAYNLTDRHFEMGMDEVCFRENVGLIAYSPLPSANFPANISTIRKRVAA